MTDIPYAEQLAERQLEELSEIRRGITELTGVMRGIEGILDDTAHIAAMQEEALGVLIWQAMPWWRRLRNSWHDAREVLDKTEDEQGTEGIIFRTTDGT
jgi:hypothetical protein